MKDDDAEIRVSALSREDDLLGPMAEFTAWSAGAAVGRVGVQVKHAAEGAVHVWGLEVDAGHRGRGIGRALMAAAVAAHRRHRIGIVPAAFNDKPMSSEELARWYMRLGFVVGPGGLVRPPDPAD